MGAPLTLVTMTPICTVPLGNWTELGAESIGSAVTAPANVRIPRPVTILDILTHVIGVSNIVGCLTQQANRRPTRGRKPAGGVRVERRVRRQRGGMSAETPERSRRHWAKRGCVARDELRIGETLRYFVAAQRLG